MPAMRADMVLRQALVDRLEDGLHRKATLVSAPPGFGKTSLICQWHRQTERSTAWLCLDEEDNDERRFLSYLVMSFQQLLPDFGAQLLSGLQQKELPGASSLMTTFINELNRIPEKTFLVIDDYHFINNPLIHQGLDFLLAHFPENLHLILCTRADPPLQLMRLRSQDQLTELRANDLRFSHHESQQFLENELDFTISPANAEIMELRLEGWIAGWQLAVISLRDHQDVEAFVRSFAGDDRYVLDYLIEQVIERQSDSIRNFLLQTSILSRFCAPLCAAVTGRIDSQDNLNYLDNANLFINPLDNKRKWYRYHQLFAELLQARLTFFYGDEVAGLHQRAGEWFEGEGLLSDAISHYVQAENWPQTISLLNRFAWSSRYKGPNSRLIHWLKMIPENVLVSEPRLCLFYAEYLATLGKIESCKTFLKNLLKIWEASPGTVEAFNLLHVRGTIAYIEADFAETRGYAREVLKTLPPEEKIIRASASVALLNSNEFLGRVRDVAELLPKALAYNQEIGNAFGAARCFNTMGKQLMLQGKLQEAEAVFRKMDQTARASGEHQLVIPNINLASIYYQWNDVSKATEHIQNAFHAARVSGRTPYLGYAYLIHAMILATTGQSEAAAAELGKGIDFIATPVLHFHKRDIRAFRALRCLQEGDSAATSTWMHKNEAQITAIPTLENELERLVAARLHLELGEIELARKLLQECEQEATGNLRTDSLIRIFVVRSQVEHSAGERDRALKLMIRALSLSQAGGYIRLYVDEGQWANALLTQISKRITGRTNTDDPKISIAYLANILAAFQNTVLSDSTNSATNRNLPDYYQLDPLSERELQVLQLVRDGLSNAEVADKLFISLNTVKTHTKKINQKLNVTSRTQAIARARQWGLLS